MYIHIANIYNMIILDHLCSLWLKMLNQQEAKLSLG